MLKEQSESSFSFKDTLQHVFSATSHSNQAFTKDKTHFAIFIGIGYQNLHEKWKKIRYNDSNKER